MFFNVFGFPFSGSKQSAGIVLPDAELDNVEVELDKQSSNLELLESVTVNKDNIKNIIEALQRPSMYHIAANSTVYYSNGQRSAAAEGYVMGDLSRSVVYEDGGRPVSSSLTSGDDVYIWNEGSHSYYSGKKGSFSQDDYIYIPTYEEILDIDDENIISADYSFYNETYCVFAEVLDEISGYRSLYYISVENGLLIGAQSFEDDELVYSLSCNILPFPEDYSRIFTLPDGKDLSTDRNKHS